MANINDFKARLAGGGARANQFRVILPPPVGVVTAGINTEQFSFLCKATSLPGQELTEIAVPFRGRIFMSLVKENLQSGLLWYLTILTLQFEEKWKDG